MFISDLIRSFCSPNGSDANIKETTTRFATQLPALAVAPDLYRGRVTTEPDEANHLMEGLDFKGAVEDIRKCAEYLRSKGCKKVGVSGFLHSLVFFSSLLF